MNKHQLEEASRSQERSLDSRLAAYVAAAGAASTIVSSKAQAVVVSNTTPQPIGINGEVNVDFNSDGQVDFQIDHDRYNLNGNDLDYLQIDKNDVSSAANPLPIDSNATFPPNGTPPNNPNQAGYIYDGPQGAYPAALQAGSSIGPGQSFDFQEGTDFLGGTPDRTIRANRLIDEDQTQIDQAVGGLPPEQVYVPTNGPNWVGLGGEVRYLGLKMDLNGTAPDMNATPADFNYGWIGVQITNEADATGVVTGWAYETEKGVDILAGDTGPVVVNADYDDDGDIDGADLLAWQRTLGDSVASGTGADGSNNGVVDGADLDLWETQFGGGTAVAAGQVSTATVPEPGSLLMAGLGGMLLICGFVLKRGGRKLAPAVARRQA